MNTADEQSDHMLPWLPLPGFVHRLSIAQRVRIGFSVGAIAIVVVSLAASYHIRHLTDSLGQVVQQADFDQATLGAMKDSVGAENGAIEGYLITGDASSLDAFNSAHARFTTAAGLLQSGSTDASDRATALQLSDLETQFRGLAQQEIALSQQGFPNAASFHWQTEGQIAEQALTNRLNQLAARRTSATHSELSSARTTEEATHLIFAPIVVITASLALFTALFASRSITRRVERLDETIEAIEKGDYNVTLTENRGDELGRLARSIRALAHALDKETREREHLLAERARGNEELAALYDLSRTVNQSLDSNEVLRVALAKLLGYTHMNAGMALLFDEPTERFRLSLSDGLTEEGAADVAGQLDDEATQRYLQKIMSSNAITRLDLNAMSFDTRPYQTAVAVPLRAKGSGRGVIILATTTQLDMSEDEERLIEGLAEQTGTALEHARLYSQSRQLAAAEERNRLARELHDSVTQTLFSISMMAQALPSLIQRGERGAERAVERATRLGDLARGALAEMRMLILELRPASLHEMGLVMALERHVAGFASREGIDASFCVDGLQRRLPPEHEDALFRIVQEALNNVVRHAQAHSVSVTLEFEPGDACVTIVDDGVGMPAARSGGGFGLISMRERAENVGGTVSVSSESGEAGHGVRVVASVPVPAATTSIAG